MKPAARLPRSNIINEPNAAAQGGLPDDYDVEDYVRDFDIFADWIEPALARCADRGTRRGRRKPAGKYSRRLIRTWFVCAATRSWPQLSGALDVMSYHHYPTVSQRCQNTSRAACRKKTTR